MSINLIVQPKRVAKAIRSHCEIRCAVEVVAPDTLPKSEMKAKRVFDERSK